jgi:hypothetical protein
VVVVTAGVAVAGDIAVSGGVASARADAAGDEASVAVVALVAVGVSMESELPVAVVVGVDVAGSDVAVVSGPGLAAVLAAAAVAPAAVAPAATAAAGAAAGARQCAVERWEALRPEWRNPPPSARNGAVRTPNMPESPRGRASAV